MKIVILAKNPFKFEGALPYFTGHSLGFAGPLIHYLIESKHDVVLASPRKLADSIETTIDVDAVRPVSDRFHHIFIDPHRLPKVPYDIFQLETEAAILEAAETMGDSTSWRAFGSFHS